MTEYEVHLVNTFETESPKDAVRLMIEWAVNQADFASYRVIDPDGHEDTIEADDLRQPAGRGTVMTSTRKFYRATLTIDIVTEGEPVPDNVTLDDLAYDITDGPWVAGYPSVVNREITGREAADALLEFASDPGFFKLDENGNDVEDEDEDEDIS